MVGGNPQGLATAERALGLQSWAIEFAQSRLQYPADEVLARTRMGRLLLEARRFGVLWRALRDFDVVHFNFGLSIFPRRQPLDSGPLQRYPAAVTRLYNLYAGALELRDLEVLKRSGKGIVVTFQGDDARQADYCRKNFEISPVSEVEPGYYSPDSDRLKRERIQRFARHADRIFSVAPDIMHVLPDHARFIPYANIDFREWEPLEPRALSSAKPVVMHAPTHGRVKGTRFILDAVGRLQAEGIEFEFELVEGLTVDDARRRYRRADLMIDQLLVGWYGGLAVELMALARPVISYTRDVDLKFIPDEMRRDLPTINATPETIYAVLKEWLTLRRTELAERGRRGRRYVERWHDPLRIAADLKREYESILATRTTGKRA